MFRFIDDNQWSILLIITCWCFKQHDTWVPSWLVADIYIKILNMNTILAALWKLSSSWVRFCCRWQIASSIDNYIVILQAIGSQEVQHVDIYVSLTMNTTVIIVQCCLNYIIYSCFHYRLCRKHSAQASYVLSLNKDGYNYISSPRNTTLTLLPLAPSQ